MATEAQRQVERRQVRRMRFSVGGSIDLYTDDKAPEAAEFVRHQLERIFDQHGFQLAITGLTFPGMYD